MNRDLVFREKIPVTILGATGSVGQKFVELLVDHPWFEIVALGASEKSVGKRYRDVVNWLMPSPLASDIGEMILQPCMPGVSGSLVFSALDASIAGEIESSCAAAGNIVISNAKNHRWDAKVPLLIPEVNSHHLELIKECKEKHQGFIVTNPNCVVAGLSIALKPLESFFGLEVVSLTSMQAISGAGYPGVPSLDILDNIIPYIAEEEEKIENEPLKILGKCEDGRIQLLKCSISAQCNRVPITDGHLACISVKLKQPTTTKEILEIWKEFRGEPQDLALPSAPLKPILYSENERYPQPKLHRNLSRGMAVSIGRLRQCPMLDFKFVALSHNTVRGAAGGAILCSELLVKKGFIYW